MLADFKLEHVFSAIASLTILSGFVVFPFTIGYFSYFDIAAMSLFSFADFYFFSLTPLLSSFAMLLFVFFMPMGERFVSRWTYPFSFRWARRSAFLRRYYPRRNSKRTRDAMRRRYYYQLCMYFFYCPFRGWCYWWLCPRIRPSRLGPVLYWLVH